MGRKGNPKIISGVLDQVTLFDTEVIGELMEQRAMRLAVLRRDFESAVWRYIEEKKIEKKVKQRVQSVELFFEEVRGFMRISLRTTLNDMNRFLEQCDQRIPQVPVEQLTSELFDPQIANGQERNVIKLLRQNAPAYDPLWDELRTLTLAVVRQLERLRQYNATYKGAAAFLEERPYRTNKFLQSSSCFLFKVKDDRCTIDFIRDDEELDALNDVPVCEYIVNPSKNLLEEEVMNYVLSKEVDLLYAIHAHNINKDQSADAAELYAFEKILHDEGHLETNLVMVDHLILVHHRGEVVGMTALKHVRDGQFYYTATMIRSDHQNSGLGLYPNRFLAYMAYKASHSDDVTFFMRTHGKYSSRIFLDTFQQPVISLGKEHAQRVITEISVGKQYGLRNDPGHQNFIFLGNKLHSPYDPVSGICSSVYSEKETYTRTSEKAELSIPKTDAFFLSGTLHDLKDLGIDLRK